MRTPRYLPLAAALLAMAFCACIAGCKSTDAFAPGHDPVIAAAQVAENSSFDALDSFIAFDDLHRDQLKQTAPTVHATAEDIRKTAPTIYRSLDEALADYKRAKLAITNAIDSVNKLKAQTAAAHAAEKQAVGAPK